MKRALLYFIKLAIALSVVVWIANRPGAVSIDWLGYRLETTVGIAILAVAAVAVLAAALYRLWRTLLGAPGVWGRGRREKRRNRGYKALTQGMVAVAAGDAQTASQLARKAESLLRDERPLTLLLSAQAAQLQGDDRAAHKYFEAMLENDETRFMGLRGLLMQAQREGDLKRALDYARQAQGMKPNTPWVSQALFELSEATGDLQAAERALQDGAKAKNLSKPEASRKRAVVKLQQALQARDSGNEGEALEQARQALKLTPDLVPAVVLVAELTGKAGRLKEAEKTLSKAWAKRPHRDLARAYLKLLASETAVERAKRLGRLVADNSDHYESHIVMAEANLDAHLWGEARRHLVAAAKEHGPSRLVCRLMARLEREENGDNRAAAQWLEKAENALVAHNWVCGDCGAIAEQWQVHCGECGAFDSLTWKRPAVSVAGGKEAVALAKAEDSKTIENTVREITTLPVPVKREEDGDKAGVKSTAVTRVKSEEEAARDAGV